MKDICCVKDMERMYRIRWSDLVHLEPQLDRHLKIARMVGAACRNWWDVEIGFSQFKDDIAGLVGLCSRHRDHAVLGTPAAYEVVYWKLHNAVARDRRGGD